MATKESQETLVKNFGGKAKESIAHNPDLRRVAEGKTGDKETQSILRSHIKNSMKGYADKNTPLPPPPLVDADLYEAKRKLKQSDELHSLREANEKSMITNTISQNNGEILDDLKAAAISFVSSNSFLKTGQELIESTNNSLDVKFARSLSVESAEQDLLARNITADADTLKSLMQSRNRENYERRIAGLSKNAEWGRFAHEYGGEYANIAAGFVGAFADPINFIYAPLTIFNRLKGGYKLASVVGANAGIQYGLSKARDVGDNSRDGVDTAIDVAFGALFDGALSYKFGKISEGKIPNPNAKGTAEDIVKQHRAASEAAIANKLSPVKKHDYSAGYNYKNAMNQTEEFVASKGKAFGLVKGYDDLVKSTLATVKANVDTDIVASTYMASRESMRNIVRDITDKIVTTKDKGIRDEYISSLNEIRSIAKANKLDVLDKKYNAGKPATKKFRSSAKEGAVRFHETVAKLTSNVSKKISELSTIRKEIDKVDKLSPETASSIGFSKEQHSKINNIKNAIVKIKSKAKQTAKTRHEIKELNKEIDSIVKTSKQIDDVVNSNSVKALEGQKRLYEHLASVIDDIALEANRSFNNIFDDLFPTAKEADAFAQQLTSDMREITGIDDMSVVFKNGELVIENTMKFTPDANGDVFVFGTKMKAAVLVTVLGSSMAMADNGNIITNNAPAVLFIAAALIFGRSAAIKKYGTLGAAFGALFKKIKSAEIIAMAVSKEKNYSFNEYRTALADNMNADILNNFSHVMNNANEFSKEFYRRIGFDSYDPSSNKNGAALNNKEAWHNANMVELHIGMSKHYDEWLGEMKLFDSMDDKIAGFAHGNEKEAAFAQDVSYYVEFGEKGRTFPPSVKKMGDIARSILKKEGKENNAAGMIGFIDEALDRAGDNYIPHQSNADIWREAKRLGLKDSIVEQLSASIRKKQPKKTVEEANEIASQLFDLYSSVPHYGKFDVASARDIVNALNKAGVDMNGMDAETLASSVRGNNNAINRGKFRIDMDLSEFKPITVTNDVGIDVTFDINNLWDRKIDSLLTKYSHESTGMRAIKLATAGMEVDGKVVSVNGLETEFAIRNMLLEEGNERSIEIIDSTIDNMMGRPSYKLNNTNRAVNVVRNFANVDLIYATLSAGGELATATQNAFFGGSKSARRVYLNNISNIFRAMAGKPDAEQPAVLKLYLKFTGLGSSAVRKDHTVRTMDAVGGSQSISSPTGIEKFSDFVRSASLVISQNMRADDMMKQVSMIKHAENIGAVLSDAKIITNADGSKAIEFGNRKLSQSYMDATGLSPELMEAIQGKLRFDKEGNLLDEIDDLDKVLGADIASKYRNVLYHAVLKDSPMEMISTTTIEKHTTSAGRLHGLFLGFTLQSFISKAAKNMKYGDSASIVETLVYMSGIYAGISAKEAIKGNEYDHEDIAYKTIMMMPFLAPVGAYNLVTSSPAVNIFNQLTSQTGHLAELAYPQDEADYQ